MSFPKIFVELLLFQATLQKQVRDLKALATGLTDREVSILAVAAQNLLVNYNFDCVRRLAVVQVETWFNLFPFQSFS